MIIEKSGIKLPGFEKKSFILPFNGGEIWFEHLDGMYEYEELALKKLENDAPAFSRPSAPSDICFVFDETTVTDKIINAVEASVMKSGKRFMRIGFSGINKAVRRKLNKKLAGNGFALGYFSGLEDAKKWLVEERI